MGNISSTAGQVCVCVSDGVWDTSGTVTSDLSDPCFDLVNCCISGGAALHVELTAKRTALLVGDSITVNCLAQGSEILEDHWKYPGKLVRAKFLLCSTKDGSKGWFWFQSSCCYSRCGIASWFETQSILFVWQANRSIKTVHENKRDQEILYTLTIPQATAKDSGIYACSITDIISNESQTKQLAVTVYGIKAAFGLLTVNSLWHYLINSYLSCSHEWMIADCLSSSLTESEFMFLQPEFSVHESAELDEVREFRAEINSFPSARVTWLKDSLLLSDVTAEISTSLRKLSETRWDSHLVH